jgi:hypothetical protein
MYPVHHAQTISPFAFSGKPEANHELTRIPFAAKKRKRRKKSLSANGLKFRRVELRDAQTLTTKKKERKAGRSISTEGNEGNKE